jgi:hypothetical protein
MLNVATVLISMFCCFYFDNENLFNLKIHSVPLFHAIIVGIGTTLLCLSNPNVLYNPNSVIEYNDNFIYNIFPLISMGYSFYDLYIGIRSKQLEYILHGVFFILLTSSFYYFNGLCILNIALVGETSTIFLNLRPIRNNIIDYLFAITFTLYRMIYIPIILFVYVYNSPCINIIGSACEIEILISIFFTLFSSLNIYWFYFICKSVLRRIKN